MSKQDLLTCYTLHSPTKLEIKSSIGISVLRYALRHPNFGTTELWITAMPEILLLPGYSDKARIVRHTHLL